MLLPEGAHTRALSARDGGNVCCCGTAQHARRGGTRLFCAARFGNAEVVAASVGAKRQVSATNRTEPQQRHKGNGVIVGMRRQKQEGRLRRLLSPGNAAAARCATGAHAACHGTKRARARSCRRLSRIRRTASRRQGVTRTGRFTSLPREPSKNRHVRQGTKRNRCCATAPHAATSVRQPLSSSRQCCHAPLCCFQERTRYVSNIVTKCSVAIMGVRWGRCYKMPAVAAVARNVTAYTGIQMRAIPYSNVKLVYMLLLRNAGGHCCCCQRGEGCYRRFAGHEPNQPHTGEENEGDEQRRWQPWRG